MSRVLLRWMASTLMLGLALAYERPARADDALAPPALAPAQDASEPSPNYLRALLEEGAILVGGVIQYASASSNAVDWDLGYNWPSFRSKLTGQTVRFDTNHFDTNMVTHPVAGTLYYVAARGNRLTFVESFLFATGSTALWEYVGEFREMVSINDLAVTPISGAVFGEAFTRLGVFFQRGRRSLVTDVLGGFFAPSTSLHDLLDGTATARDEDVDSLGLTRAIGHRFAVRVGAGRVEASDRSSVLDARFAVESEVIDVEGFHAAGSRATSLFDSSVSRLHVEGAFTAAGMRDLQVDALVAPIAFYAHDLQVHGRGLVGERFLVGTTLGFDYGLHSYSALPYAAALPTDRDQLAGVHAAGVTAEYSRKGQHLRVRTMLDVHPELAAVHAIALRDYATRGGAAGRLSSVMVDEGYYHALGAVVAPTVELGAGPFTLGAQARFEWYWGIQGLDRRQEEIRDQAEVRDSRTLGRLYLSYAPAPALEARVTLERRGRDGEVADVQASRSEWAIASTLGVVF